MSFFDSFKTFFGNDGDVLLLEARKELSKVNAKASWAGSLADADFPQETAKLKARIVAGETLDSILPEAFALVREAGKRTLNQYHFDVQILGGVVLHKGGISEMKTGEGKTLVATLPAYLNALSGKGVHVVTVNDYLSKRDAVWMGQVYAFLGLSTSVINHDVSYVYDESVTGEDEERDQVGSFKVVEKFLRPVSRREAYLADITYGTNSEFGFDYLRDNIEREPSKVRQRPFNFAIVDEIDSILIDEARTPLIISMPSGETEGLYGTFAALAARLKESEHYTVDEKHHSIALTEAGIDEAEKSLGVSNIYSEQGIRFVHLLETAVKAKALYRNDKEYVVRDGEVVIIDEFTGRAQPGRRWSEGLHQAIEAKENVKVKEESRTYASVTYQNFFRMYEKLSGMTGTAKTSAEEFKKVYGLTVVEIPTNRVISRLDRNDLIFKNEKGKFLAIARKVKELHAKGQPVLIGTVSIEKNELLSEFLTAEGVPHEILNAKNHAREGEIIAQAGKKGAVTIATNMAGRGVDIKLGGNPNTPESYEEIKSFGGLFVLGTERHEARRIDNQLRGRSGRQGDPGETQFFVSLEDSLMRVFAADLMKGMMNRLGVAEDQPIQQKMITRSLERAQERIEGFNFDVRKRVLEFDDVMNSQRRAVYGERMSLLLGDIEVSKKQYNVWLSAVTDDLKTDVEKVRAVWGDEKFFAILRSIALQTIDMYWIEHLEVMDHVRNSVNLRAYGQRDPLVEYKKEGLMLYRAMRAHVSGDTLVSLVRMREEEEKRGEELVASSEKAIPDALGVEVSAFKKEDVGRNEPCPCGSGKKYKKCHGA